MTNQTTIDLPTILRSWEAEARAMTKGEKPLYHMQIRLAPGETIQQAQWFRTLEIVEKKLKLADHPRVVVAHNLNSEAHLHVVFSRLDYERGKLLNMGNDRQAHHAAARQMEQEFGLREVDSTPRRDRNGNEKTRSIEHRMAKESGTTRKTLCNQVKAAWQASGTGRQFQENLARLGITMTRGDQRDYNLWHEGKRYDPVRLLEKVRTAEFRAIMQIEPPRISEHKMPPVTAARETPPQTGLSNQPTRRRARNLTSGQITRNLVNVDPPLSDNRPAPEALTRAIACRIRAKNRSREEMSLDL